MLPHWYEVTTACASPASDETRRRKYAWQSVPVSLSGGEAPPGVGVAVEVATGDSVVVGCGRGVGVAVGFGVVVTVAVGVGALDKVLTLTSTITE